MSKSSYQGANVEIATDTFGGLVNKTNQVIFDMGTVVMTTGDVAQPNTTNGAETSGNAHIEGIMSIDTLAVPTTLRGGTVSVPAPLSITSNAVFSSISEVVFDNVGTVNVKPTSNTKIEGHTVFNGLAKTILVDLGTGSTTIDSGAVFINSNTTITTANVEFNVTKFDVNGVFNHVGTKAYLNTSNTTIGANNSQDLNINSNSVLNGTAIFNDTITGNGVATFNADAIFNSDVTLGNATTDTVTYVSRIASDILPNNTTRGLGNETLPWAEFHGINAYIDADVEAKGELRLHGATDKVIRTKSTTTAYKGLDIVLETSTGNAKTPMSFGSTSVVSGANATFDLGTSANVWKNIHGKDLAVANSAVITNALNVTGATTLSTAKVSDLTSGRVTYAGAGGELMDNAGLTFNGTDLTAPSMNVSDLTSGRMVFTTAGGGLVDNASLTFDGAHLTVPSLKVSDLTNGRVALVGLNGELVDDADITFAGDRLTTKNITVTTDISVGGATTLGNATNGNTTVKGDLVAEKTLNVTGATTLSTAKVSDLTSGRVTYAGAGGELMDSSNLTFNGTELSIPSVKVSGLTSGRVALVGAAGVISDDADITFSADTLTVSNIAVTTDLSAGGTISLGNALTGNTTVKGDLIAQKALNVTGATTLSTAKVSDLTSGRVTYAGAGGELMDSSTFTFAASRLTVPNANVVTDFMVGGFVTLGNAAGGDTEIKGSLTVDKDLNILGNTYFAGNTSLSYAESHVQESYVSGILDVSGNTVIGSANTDVVAMNARVSSDIIPSTNNLRNIGSATHKWKDVHATKFVGDIEWSNVLSKPDPVITVSLSGDVSGSASTTLTNLSNGTVAISTTVQPNSVALGTDTTGIFVGSVSGGAGIDVTGADGEGVTKTIAHSDTSSTTDLVVNNSAGTVLQDITLDFDGFGHVVGRSVTSVDLDGRYVQSAFNSFVTPNATIVSDSKTDTLTMANGSGISITGNATTDTITIASTDDIDDVVARGNTTTRNVTFGDITGDAGNFGGDLTVTGNLYVNGTTTTVNTEQVNIADNVILLNSNETGTPTQDAGFAVERGTLSNKYFVWDESHDRWTVQGEEISAGIFSGALVGNADTTTKLATARTIALSGDVTGSVSFDGSSNVTISATVPELDAKWGYVQDHTGGVDLNTVTAPGMYETSLSVNADGPNYPVGLAGMLYVEADDSHVYQTYRLYNNNGTYQRTRYQGSWFAWERIFADNYHPNADKLTTARTIALSGDVSGSVSFDGTSNVTITATVADDSHNHTIANVDGLQTALDSKLGATAKAVDSDKLDGYSGTSYARLADVNANDNYLVVNRDSVNSALYVNNYGTGEIARFIKGTSRGAISSDTMVVITATGGVDADGAITASSFTGVGSGLTSLNASNISSGTISDARLPASITSNASTATKLATARTISLGGDLSGSASFDGSSNVTITATVADDSHNHTIANVDGLQTALDSKLGATAKAADSDLLDGLNHAQFLRADSDTIASGKPTFQNGLVVTGEISGTPDSIKISGAGPRIGFYDTSTTNGDDFFIQANGDQFYILTDRNNDGNFDSPNALQIQNNTEHMLLYGKRVFEDSYHPNADTLTTARTISLGGDLSGSASFDGSSNVTISATVSRRKPIYTSLVNFPTRKYSGTITLSQSINSFDALLIKIGNHNYNPEKPIYQLIPRDFFEIGDFAYVGSNSFFMILERTNNTTLSIDVEANSYIYTVYGVTY